MPRFVRVVVDDAESRRELPFLEPGRGAGRTRHVQTRPRPLEAMVRADLCQDHFLEAGFLSRCAFSEETITDVHSRDSEG